MLRPPVSNHHHDRCMGTPIMPVALVLTLAIGIAVLPIWLLARLCR